MPSIRPVFHVAAIADVPLSRVTDLAFVSAGGRDWLVAGTRFDGTLSVWSVDGGRLTATGSTGYGRTDAAGAVAHLALLPLAGGPALLTGGGGTGALALRPLGGNGETGPARSLGAPLAPWGGDLVDPEVARLPDGGLVVVGGIAGGGGLARLTFSAQGTLTGVARTADTGAVHADGVVALAQAQVAGQTLVFSAGGADPGLTAWALAANGVLVARDSMGVAEGLWISGATVLETARLGGETFLILGAAGSGSLSVVAVAADGALSFRDHVIDDLASRFAGITALAVVEHQGRVFIVAGGADDGLSLLELLPGGRLLSRAHLADATGTALANVAAIAARSSGSGIDIVAASSVDPGMTRFRVETGPQGLILTAPAAGGTLTGGAGGDLLSGGAGSDSLSGGAGADVLRDGAGSDRMAGGTGADVFVLGRDGVADAITDFTPGEDRIDLSAWAGLRSPRQLWMTTTADGFRITYGTEVLSVRTAAGTPFDPAALTAADLIGDSHLTARPEPGLPGPDPGPPANPPVTFKGDARDDRVTGGPANDTLTGGEGSDSLSGGAGGDVLAGEAGHDSLSGDDGNDRIWGGEGNDRLIGGQGLDTLWGGAGDDSLWGSLGNDRLVGGLGDDWLRGEDGDDRIAGNPGQDHLWGGAGNDRLAGGPGNDRIAGDAGNDRLRGGPGHDTLDGGAGDDVIAGAGGNDRLAGGADDDALRGRRGDDLLSGGLGEDMLNGGAGRDRIAGGAGADILRGGRGADTFVFAAGDGADRITDFRLTGGDRLWLDPALWGGGLSAAAVVREFATLRGGDAVLDFGGGDILRIEDVTALTRLDDLILLTG